MTRWSCILLASLLAATAASAAPVTLAAGNVTAPPGVAVSVPVSLDPADQVVLGIQNDISPSPLAPVRRLPDGRPDCTVDPAVGPLLSSAFSNFFVCIAEEGGTCTRLRAILIRSTTDPTPFPTGTLYSCVYDVDPAATTGTSLPVTVLAPRAYNERLLFVPETHAENGSIEVVAPSPTPIDTASATPTPTPTSTPSVTSTSAPTSTRTPSATPTSTSLTPSATPTPTETPAVEIHIAASAAPPGGATQIDVDLVDRTGLVAGPGFDLLVPEDVFASAEISCDIDPRLPLYGVTATALKESRAGRRNPSSALRRLPHPVPHPPDRRRRHPSLPASGAR